MSRRGEVFFPPPLAIPRIVPSLLRPRSIDNTYTNGSLKFRGEELSEKLTESGSRPSFPASVRPSVRSFVRYGPEVGIQAFHSGAPSARAVFSTRELSDSPGTTRRGDFVYVCPERPRTRPRAHSPAGSASPCPDVAHYSAVRNFLSLPSMMHQRTTPFPRGIASTSGWTIVR